MSRAALLASLVFLASVPFASAATLKVPQQFATIQEAVDAAQSGDVVQIAKGTYVENVEVGKTNVRIVGKPGAILDGGGVDEALVIGFSTFVTVEGLTVQNSGAFPAILIGISVNVEVSNCKVQGDFTDGILVTGASNVRLVDNQVTGAGEDGIQIESDDVLVSGNTVKSSDSANIRVIGSYNTIEDNVLDSSGVDSISLGDGGTTTTSSNLIVGNTNTNAGSDGIFLNGAPLTWIVDNQVSTTLADEGIDDDGDSEGSVIVGNSVKKATGTGIELDSVELSVLENSVKASGDDGLDLEVNADGAYAYGNVIKKSVGNGVLVNADDVVLVKNSATGSGSTDLAGGGANLVQIDNNFPFVL
jgi:parallel beta-helix repeat protein